MRDARDFAQSPLSLPDAADGGRRSKLRPADGEALSLAEALALRRKWLPRPLLQLLGRRPELPAAFAAGWLSLGLGAEVANQ